jgi:heme a synthase
MLVTSRHRTLFLATSIVTTLLVILGGVVCVTDSSQGCPDWPACHGRLFPPPRLDSILEYTHRVAAGATSVLILTSAVIGVRRYRAIPWLSRPPVIAAGFLLAVVVLGAMVVLRGLEPGLAALDLGSALLVQALVIMAAVVAAAQHRDPSLSGRLAFDGALVRLAMMTLVAVCALLVSGVLVAADGSTERCLSWPLYGIDAGGRLQGIRPAMGALAGVLVLAVVARAWRAQGAMRRTAMALGMLLLAEIGVGALIVLGGPTLLLEVAYVVLAAGVWALLLALFALAGLPASASPMAQSA